MTRLQKLREGAKKQNSPEFDAALTAMCATAPAWLLAHGLTGGGWGWAALLLLCGPLALFLAFIIVCAVLEGALGTRRAELAGFAAGVAASAFWCFPRYGAWGLLPIGAGAGVFAISLATAKKPQAGGVPAEIADILAALPKELPAAVQQPIEKALAAVEHLDETLRQDLAGDTGIDGEALRADVMAALRAMAERARLSTRLAEAARGGSEKLAAAAAEAQAQIEAVAAQVHAASEATLLYAAARQAPAADELKSRASALRAATASLRELAALEARP